MRVIYKGKNKKHLPVYKTPFSACFDLFYDGEEDVVLQQSSVKALSTGLFVELENFLNGYYLEIRPRSGLALKEGVTVANSPGTVDEDYPDEIKVILVKHTPGTTVIKKGDRIAQAMVKTYTRPSNVLIEDNKRTGGFGSTGK